MRGRLLALTIGLFLCGGLLAPPDIAPPAAQAALVRAVEDLMAES